LESTAEDYIGRAVASNYRRNTTIDEAVTSSLHMTELCSEEEFAASFAIRNAKTVALGLFMGREDWRTCVSEDQQQETTCEGETKVNLTHLLHVSARLGHHK
jgi:hypothetical protein